MADNSPCGETRADWPARIKMPLPSCKGTTPTLPARQLTINDPSEGASILDVDCSPSATATITVPPARKVIPIGPFKEVITILPNLSSAAYWGPPANAISELGKIRKEPSPARVNMALPDELVRRTSPAITADSAGAAEPFRYTSPVAVNEPSDCRSSCSCPG